MLGDRPQGLGRIGRWQIVLVITGIWLLSTVDLGMSQVVSRSLRIGTFNAQFLPFTPSSRVLHTCCDDIDDRPRKLADRILASGYDIIALNEVFVADVQEELVNALRGEYPHYVQFVDGRGEHSDVERGFLYDADGCITIASSLLGWDNCQDSGLMLFSKFPFVPLPTSAFRVTGSNLIAQSGGAPWRDVAFIEFALCAQDGSDCYANKGAALIRVRYPDDDAMLNIVFTHLNAGSSSFAATARASQLAQIRELVLTALPGHLWMHEPLIILGDMNINGDIRAERPEWRDHFSTAAPFLSTIRDAWESSMNHPDDRPPLDASEPGQRDRGLTSGPYKDLSRHTRIDYILRNDARVINDELCYQHMTIAHNLAHGEAFWEGGLGMAGSLNLSDHYGVNADINAQAAFCNSASARLVEDREFSLTGTATLRGPQIQIRFPGGMQWFRLAEAGTYSIAIQGSGGFEPDFRVYQSRDLSRPLCQYKSTTRPVCQSGGATKDIGGDFTGKTFHIEEGPFYIRVFAPERTATGSYRLIINRHRGSTREDAISLLPNQPQFHMTPTTATTLGYTGRTWFRIDTDAPYSDAPQSLRFFMGPMVASAEAKIELRDETGGATTGLAPAPRDIATRRRDFNRVTLYLVIDFEDLDTSHPYAVGWETNLNVFHLDERQQLICIEQTDSPDEIWFVDVTDDDNVKLQVTADGRRLFSVSPSGDLRFNFGDFDTGQGAALTEALPCSIGFLGALEVELEEDDSDLSGSNDILRTTIPRLPSSRLRRADVANLIGSGGHYRFDYQLSRGFHGLQGGFMVPDPGSGRPVCRP